MQAILPQRYASVRCSVGGSNPTSLGSRCAHANPHHSLSVSPGAAVWPGQAARRCDGRAGGSPEDGDSSDVHAANARIRPRGICTTAIMA